MIAEVFVPVPLPAGGLAAGIDEAAAPAESGGGGIVVKAAVVEAAAVQFPKGEIHESQEQLFPVALSLVLPCDAQARLIPLSRGPLIGVHTVED